MTEGWSEEKLSEVLDVLDDMYQAAYEIRNCRRGCYTGVERYDDLGRYLCNLADRLSMASEVLDADMDRYDEDDEDDE